MRWTEQEFLAQSVEFLNRLVEELNYRGRQAERQTR